MKRNIRLSLGVETLESRLTPTVTYHGGALMPHVEAQNVFLGSDWSTSSSLKTTKASLDSYIGYIVNSPYMDALTTAGYNVGRGTATAGVVDSINITKTKYLTDSSIQSEVQKLITSGSVAAPDANRLYVVYVEPGVKVRDSDGSTSVSSFLGYHGAFAGKTAAAKSIDVRYVVLPNPGTPNPTPSSQGFASTFQELTAVTSHELAEAVTDPDVGYKKLGWYDDTKNGEIGDLTDKLAILNGYTVQRVVGKNDSPLSIPTGTNQAAVASSSASTASQRAASVYVSIGSFGNGSSNDLFTFSTDWGSSYRESIFVSSGSWEVHYYGNWRY